MKLTYLFKPVTLWGSVAELGSIMSLVLFSAWATTHSARADGLNHEYNWRNRSPYQSNVYFSNQVTYNQTRLSKVQTSAHATSATSGQPSLKDAVRSPESNDIYQGHTLQAALGVEHFRFVQTGVHFSHSQLSLQNDKRSTLYGQEVGAHVKLVLSSPLINVSLFGGPHLSQKNFLSPLGQGQLQGTGATGGVEFVYFLSTKVGLFGTGSVTQESLRKSSATGAVQSLESRSSRVGLGFSLWF